MKGLVHIIMAAMCLIAVSCGNKQLETTYEQQETNIQAIAESLTNSNSEATVDYNDGSVRVTVAHGQGEALKEGGAVSFYFAGLYISGSRLSNNNIFATNYDTFANSIKWNVIDSSAFKILTVNLAEDDVVEGLRNGLIGVKGGDECYVMFSGKHGFKKKKVANVPIGAALAYHLWIKSVSNN